MLDWKKNEREEAPEVGGRPLEGAVGDRKRTTAGRGEVAPDPELVQRSRRRSFTAKYKLEILAQTDRGSLCQSSRRSDSMARDFVLSRLQT